MQLRPGIDSLIQIHGFKIKYSTVVEMAMNRKNKIVTLVPSNSDCKPTPHAFIRVAFKPCASASAVTSEK